MLIGCRFHRPKAPVELANGTYFFTPIDPSNSESEHVCEVSNLEDAQRLLGIPEGYYISAAAPIPTTARPVAQQPAAPTGEATSTPNGSSGSTPSVATTTTATNDGTVNSTATGSDPEGSKTTPESTVPSGLPADLEEAAKNLNALSFQKLTAELKAGGLQEAVVRRALDIELSKPEDDQRATTVKALKKHLGVA